MKQNSLFRIFIFSILFMLPLTMVAQTIKGKVIDSSGEGVPYMNVVEKGTTNGTTSDDAGAFSIDVKSLPTILVVSSMGFETKEVSVTDNSFLTVSIGEDNSLEEVVVIGSRNKSRTAIDTPVPVDIIDVKELLTSGPQVNLNQILNYVAPSFSSNTQTISDGTDHIDPASLRGLGPDQVLVLINGKRRHTSSLVNVNGTFGRGSVGTDLNAIPAAAIKRIEVLRDGAAAQYGSDAIAGVINIILNDVTDELNISVTNGANVSSNSNSQTGGIDGETINISANYGIKLGDNGGFINFTGDFDVREDYNRMKEWEGNIFNAYNSVEWVANNSGLDLSDMSLTDIQFAAQGVTHFDLATKNAINGASSLTDLQGLLAFDTTEAELLTRGQSRSDYNMRVGQSKVRGGRFFVNFALPLDDNGTELYSFAGMGSRNGNSAGFYRLPNQSRTYTPQYINGFLPEINSTVQDQSIAVGIKGKIGEWDVDFSNTWGKNSFLYTIDNTANASLLSATPTIFNAGGFSFAQNTANLDFSKNYEDTLSGLNIAFGAEYRTETYEIVAGQEESYTTYDANGIPVTNSTVGAPDFFGNSRPGGSQVFPGFGPDNALLRNRNNVAGYLDIEADITEKLLVTAAARFENYSDFGSTLNYKVASRYKLNENMAVRAAFNTGFRAPSLHQLYFNSTSTIFDQEGNPQEVGTFTNDSKAAKAVGIPELKEEESASLSIGFTAKIPDANLKVTLDAYWVGIEDRVVYTGQFKGAAIAEYLNKAGAEAASFFANAIDTESKGLDFVITHKANLTDKLVLKTDLAGTFSQTRQVDDIHSSQIIKDAGLESTYFPEDSRVYLEEAVPRTKLNLSNSLTAGRFNFFLRNVYFGKVTEATNNTFLQQEFSSKVVTDLSIGFKATDNLRVTVGANNLFDMYPDRAEANIDYIDSNGIGQSKNNRSGGRFDWSRRAQQFGIGGRFLFARLNFILK
jgi:iron complex outermembrane receptor protein